MKKNNGHSGTHSHGEINLLALPLPTPTEAEKVNQLYVLAPQHFHLLGSVRNERTLEDSRKRIAETLASKGASWEAAEALLRERHSVGKLKNVPTEELLAVELKKIQRFYIAATV